MVKILFMVDDDQDDREIFKEAINHCHPNIQVIFAQDGVEALEVLSSPKEYPDVIFLDYNMPQMNGVECLIQLKADPKTKHIPTIMYTTAGDRELEKAILLLGADYYMKKTNSYQQLCDELDRLITMIDKGILKGKRIKPHP
jgi:CheY-like chemotaxis protein